jgi:hypothetical protein
LGQTAKKFKKPTGRLFSKPAKPASHMAFTKKNLKSRFLKKAGWLPKPACEWPFPHDIDIDDHSKCLEPNVT